MFSEKEYERYIINSKHLTQCQQKEFLNTKINIFYVDIKSNKQVITYIDHASRNDLNRLYSLFNHFLKSDFVDLLMNGIKGKRYVDDHIYQYILKHKEAHQKHKFDNKLNCAFYVYIFELLVLKLHTNFFKDKKINYLDIGCGNGFKAQLFGNKLGLPYESVYGTDISEWGPYLNDKKNMPINFKLIKNGKLDFDNGEFDMMTLIFTLHHIEPEKLDILLKDCERVLKKQGLLIIFEHQIMNDYDHLIVDIEHSINSYLYDGKPDDNFSQYYNWSQIDYLLKKYNFELAGREPITDSVNFNVRFDNPYYAIYKLML